MHPKKVPMVPVSGSGSLPGPPCDKNQLHYLTKNANLTFNPVKSPGSQAPVFITAQRSLPY